MSITTSQQIARYYETYKAIDVTFTKEVIKATGLQTPGVFLKCVGEQWPCVIYSTSFSGAKVLASARGSLADRIRKANNSVSLRFSFKFADKADPVSFFVSAKATGFAPYAQSGGDLQFIMLEYTQRPPDDLLETLGRLLEANVNSARRRDERILVTPDNASKLQLVSKETVVLVQGVPRKCIVRDVSFSGAKLILVGLAKFLVGRDCLLRLEFHEPRETIDIPGKFVRYEDVEGRKDLAAVGVVFDSTGVPMSYKLHVNECLSQQRKKEPGEAGPGAGGSGAANAQRRR
ncbi:MAG: PilZ domain-containing protein [Spirochaetales bacterium]|nr:PilZ domain-containing protein [Spirochaetales bacterium]